MLHSGIGSGLVIFVFGARESGCALVELLERIGHVLALV